MNERIRQLAEQVVGPSRLHGGDFALMGNEQVERFAALIVQECMEVSLKCSHRDDDMGAIIARQIKQHFGV